MSTEKKRSNPWDKYSPEEQAEFRRIGLEKAHSPEGIAKSKETRAKKKCLRDLTRFMLEADLQTEDEAREMLVERGFEASEQGAMILALVNKAKAGDVEAFKTLRDTSGQKPVDGLQLGGLDDDPIGIDLRTIPTDQLAAMIAKRRDDLE